jgi:hypothetical protein
MSARLRQIIRKRRMLVALANEQRGEFALQAAALQQSLTFVDLAWRSYRRVKSSPLVGVVVAAGLALVGPGKLVRVGYRSGLLIIGLLRIIRVIRALH